MSRKQKTGNIAVDAVYSCLAHYKVCRKRVQYVNLSALWWTLFTDWVQENYPQLAHEDAIQFRSMQGFHHDIIIRKGHRFMREKLEVEFYQETAKAEA